MSSEPALEAVWLQGWGARPPARSQPREDAARGRSRGAWPGSSPPPPGQDKGGREKVLELANPSLKEPGVKSSGSGVGRALGAEKQTSPHANSRGRRHGAPPALVQTAARRRGELHSPKARGGSTLGWLPQHRGHEVVPLPVLLAAGMGTSGIVVPHQECLTPVLGEVWGSGGGGGLWGGCWKQGTRRARVRQGMGLRWDPGIPKFWG